MGGWGAVAPPPPPTLPSPTFLQSNENENCELYVSLKKALNQPVLKISFRRAWTIYTNILIFSKDTF